MKHTNFKIETIEQESGLLDTVYTVLAASAFVGILVAVYLTN